MAMFLSVTLVHSSSQQQAISDAGSTLLAGVYIVTAVGFLVYSNILARQLRQAGGSITGKDGKQQTNHRSKLAQKMHVIGVVVSIAFAFASIVWIVSVWDSKSVINRSSVFTVLFLSADVVCLLAMLWLFKGAVDKAVEGEKTHRSSSSMQLDKPAAKTATGTAAALMAGSKRFEAPQRRTATTNTAEISAT